MTHETQPSAVPEQKPGQQRKPGIAAGAFVGLLLTAPLIGIFYLANVLLNLPFVPFDLFDWLARTLPGDVIRFGINRMVDLITTLDLGETSSVAKTLEQVQGVAFVLGIGIVAGALLFTVLSRQGKPRPYLLAGGLGLVIGIAFALIKYALPVTSPIPTTVQAVWIIAAFYFWGMAFAWVYTDLRRATPKYTDGVEQINRRQFLIRLGGTTATLTVVTAGGGALLNLMMRGTSSTDVADGSEAASQVDMPVDLPNENASVTRAPGTRMEYTPLDEHYRIDISTRPPEINASTWRLNVSGMVEEPLEISLDELKNNYESVDQFVTLSCISNRIAGDLISTTRWTGVPLHRLLDDWNLQAGATHLRIVSADGFDEWVSIETIRSDERVMLCYAWDGQPLKQKHGFPLRIYIPDLYGMKQPKWITDIEVVDEWGAGYWVERRWDEEAEVQMTSVIDTVAVNAAYEEDGQIYVPIGGIAYSGAKGISRVEVKVDNGDWQEARLRDPLSELTWVIWRYDWPYASGNHTFEVRAFDADGNAQVTEESGTFPDGATGIHQVSTNVPSNIQPDSEQGA